MSIAFPPAWDNDTHKSLRGMARSSSGDEWFQPRTWVPKQLSDKACRRGASPTPVTTDTSPDSVFDFYAFRNLCAGKKAQTAAATQADVLPASQVVFGFALPSAANRTTGAHSNETASQPPFHPTCPRGLLSQLIREHESIHHAPVRNFAILPGVRRCLAPPPSDQLKKPQAIRNPDPLNPLPSTQTQRQQKQPSPIAAQQAFLQPQTPSPLNSWPLPTDSEVSSSPLPQQLSVTSMLSDVEDDGQHWNLFASSGAGDDSPCSAQERALPSIDPWVFSGLDKLSLDLLEDKWREYCAQDASYNSQLSKLLNDISNIRRAQRQAQQPRPTRHNTDPRTQWWGAYPKGFVDALRSGRGLQQPANGPSSSSAWNLCRRLLGL